MHAPRIGVRGRLLKSGMTTEPHRAVTAALDHAAPSRVVVHAELRQVQASCLMHVLKVAGVKMLRPATDMTAIHAPVKHPTSRIWIEPAPTVSASALVEQHEGDAWPQCPWCIF